MFESSLSCSVLSKFFFFFFLNHPQLLNISAAHSSSFLFIKTDANVNENSSIICPEFKNKSSALFLKERQKERSVSFYVNRPHEEELCRPDRRHMSLKPWPLDDLVFIHVLFSSQ